MELIELAKTAPPERALGDSQIEIDWQLKTSRQVKHQFNGKDSNLTLKVAQYRPLLDAISRVDVS